VADTHQLTTLSHTLVDAAAAVPASLAPPHGLLQALHALPTLMASGDDGDAEERPLEWVPATLRSNETHEVGDGTWTWLREAATEALRVRLSAGWSFDSLRGLWGPEGVGGGGEPSGDVHTTHSTHRIDRSRVRRDSQLSRGAGDAAATEHNATAQHPPGVTEVSGVENTLVARFFSCPNEPGSENAVGIHRQQNYDATRTCG
jgi:hypothetical protein